MHADLATEQAPVFVPLEALTYAHGAPQVSATIKQELADFQVDEELGFDFTGAGEHLCLQVRKSDLSTADVAKRLQAVTGVAPAVIGYAGMKDRRGVCSQWFSVQLPAAAESRVAAIEDACLTILQTQRNARKLKIGSHKLNHFQIRLRDCAGSQAFFEERLQRIQATGIPNYFGQQRFGRDLSNLVQVQELMTSVLDPHRTDVAANVGARGKHFKRGMLYSAARAYLFNQILSQRVAVGNWNSYVPGDVLNLAGTNRCFAIAEAAWDDVLQTRLETFDIHLTGPLSGQIDPKDKYVSRAQAADIEGAVLRQFTTLVQGLERCGLMAARRPLRFVPLQMSWEWETDAVLRLRFALSKGSYATSVLRELCNVNSHVFPDEQ